jgi:hypothetical protein
MKYGRPRTPTTPPGPQPRYRARILDDSRHDPYQLREKPAGSTRCGQCHAVFERGRWCWTATPGPPSSILCPACRRLRDHAPAGWLTLEGPTVATQGEMLARLALHEAEHERDEHPMHRIMDSVRHGDRVEITTTDIHLPQRIGKAIARAHGGDLDIRYADDAYAVRVVWRG